jgi:hypothetical protein
MAQRSEAVQVGSVVEQDPHRAMQNSLERMRLANERARGRGDVSALVMLSETLDEELGQLEEVLRRLRPS